MATKKEKKPYFKMKLNIVKASGSSEKFHSALKKRNNLVKKDYGASDIIIAAPHHAPKGQDKIAGGTRVADNNTGYVARNIADHCKGKLVVATRANKDPNKEDGTYQKHTIGQAPKVHVEIHGHKGGPTRPNDVEVSCGSSEYTRHSENLAGKIRLYLNKIADEVQSQDPEVATGLRELKVSGKYDDLVMKAAHTKSITDARNKGIMPYHIELAPQMRRSDQGTKKSIPKLGTYVSQAIAAALADAHDNSISKRSSKLDELLR